MDMHDNQLVAEFEEETVELLAEMAEAEGNSVDEQLLKMMAVYTTTNLISKTERFQELLTEQSKEI
ncbi:hypothetical protein SAMN05444422_1062 [Halobiforma haloterrestris]|uniref:Uncharacterized protein n=2 Tax=Natronobacterium haloterrestre TaxID=148448 RepID=A0A1I1HJ28_NATHA|nr:hypothetical protein SAMN05444422_1062 [Halobiforma haloterrestris]